MSASFGQIISLYQEVMWQGFVVFLRVGSVVMVLPAFGEQSVPLRVKLSIAFCFTIIVALTAPFNPTTYSSLTMNSLVRHLIAEPINGLVLGIGFRLFVHALQTAGAIAAQALSLSQIIGGAGVDPMPALGQVLVIAGLAIAVMAGLHVQAAEAIILSYSLLPIGQFPLAEDISRWGVTQVSKAFWLAFSLASPFLIVSVLYNLTLGVINRAMPQLMVAFIGAPAVTFAALGLMMLVSPFILLAWLETLATFSSNPFGTNP